MAQIICEDVTLGYDGKAVQTGITFAVEAGDYLCIVGENGSGKSTLVKTVLGLLPPLDGRITFGDGLRAGEIGYLPQQTIVQQDFPASVREIVLSGCQGRRGFSPFYTAQDRQRAARAMERMEITDLAGRCYRELSGGQQQRVLLARALCAAKKVLLLDEPTAGLDPYVTEEMYALVRSLNREDGMTIMMISHDMTAALKYADHILHVGACPFFGAKEEYIRTDLAKKFAGEGEK